MTKANFLLAFKDISIPLQKNKFSGGVIKLHKTNGCKKFQENYILCWYIYVEFLRWYIYVEGLHRRRCSQKASYSIQINFFSCNSSVRYLHFISGSRVPLNCNMHRTWCNNSNETSDIKNGENDNNKKEVLHGKISYVKIKSSKHFKQHRHTRILVFRYIFCRYDKRTTQHQTVDKKAQKGIWNLYKGSQLMFTSSSYLLIKSREKDSEI